MVNKQYTSPPDPYLNDFWMAPIEHSEHPIDLMNTFYPEETRPAHRTLINTQTLCQITSITSGYIKQRYCIKMPGNWLLEKTYWNSQLEQLYLWFYRFDSPLTNISIVLKSRTNVTLLLIIVSRVLQGVRLTMHCAGLLYW